MKKLLLAIMFLAFASVAGAQSLTESTDFEMPLGTFEGSGNIASGFHTIKVVSSLGNILITYGGATKCTAILNEADNPGVYKEDDIYVSTTGKVAADSCKEKGFVVFVNQGTGLIYHRGSTADEAKEKPMPVNLKRTKR